jgi:uncharacterized protein
MKRFIIMPMVFLSLLSHQSWGADLQKGIQSALSGNFQEALNELQPLALRGSAHAQSLLGEMYFRGDGVKQNYLLARKWFRRSAQQGWASANYKLGMLYRKGLGVKPNNVSAAFWYRAGAERGDADAQKDLGILYALGEGVDRNLLFAHMWSNIAARNGSNAAAKVRDELEKGMSDHEVGEAKTLANQFHNGYQYAGELDGLNKEGFGVTTYFDGNQHTGNYKENLKEGNGSYIWSDGKKYIGSFSKGLIDGQGTMYFVDGSNYSGAFKRGHFHGQGVYKSPEGQKKEGLWYSGEFLEKWTIDDLSQNSKTLLASLDGNVTHGDKLRLRFVKDHCQNANILTTFYTTLPNPNTLDIKDQKIRVVFANQDTRANVAFVSKFLLGYSAMLDLGWNNVEQLKHIFNGEDHLSMRLVQGPDFQPSVHFDILENNWSISGIEAALDYTSELCEDLG